MLGKNGVAVDGSLYIPGGFPIQLHSQVRGCYQSPIRAILYARAAQRTCV